MNFICKNIWLIHSSSLGVAATKFPHDVRCNLLLVFSNILIRFSLIGWYLNFQ